MSDEVQQWVEVAVDVEQSNRLGMQSELSPREHLEQLVKGAKAARQRDKAVGQSHHQRFALVHGIHDMQLVVPQIGRLAYQQVAGYYADDLSATLANRRGDRAHQSVAGAAVDQTDAAASQSPAKLGGRLHEQWACPCLRAAEHAQSHFRPIFPHIVELCTGCADSFTPCSSTVNAFASVARGVPEPAAMSVEHSTANPTQAEPKPPFPEQSQAYPGRESEMQPRPDFGEQSYRGSSRLTGKKAVVTGGDSGIGRAVAVAFAREGADVLISYLNEEDDAQETARVVRESGRTCITVPGDLGREQRCQQIVERAIAEFGQIDILVNNAAYQMTRDGIGDISTDEWDHTLKTNLYAMFWLCKAALPKMKEGGAIINTSSIQAYQPSPTLLAYATTKGAIITFTKALAQEASKAGIRVNSVAPGPIWTPLIPSTMPPDHVASFGENTPLGRAGQPVELAPVYVFLASSESSYITGEVIGVTGGRPLA